MAARGCAQDEGGVRSREFERWQSHLIPSRKVLPDAKSRWPGGSSTAARPAAIRSWSESTLAARAEHTRSYKLLSVHSARRTRGYRRAGEHNCAPLNAASSTEMQQQIAGALMYRRRFISPLCVKELFTPAAQPRLRKFW